MAFRNFWDNEEFPTPAGPRRLQDEFLWQLTRVLAYLRGALPARRSSWCWGSSL